MRDCGSLKRAQKGRETCPFRAPNGFNEIRLSALERMAGTTRLELATSAVTESIDIKRCRRTSFDTTRYRMSFLIVPLLYPDLAELPNFPDLLPELLPVCRPPGRTDSIHFKR